MTKLPPGTVAAFLTLGGATVAVTEDDSWRCLGCGEGTHAITPVSARREANAHSARCRSIPLPDKH